LISRTLIMRHLHQQIRISESSLVWTRPVTANLYRLYVADAAQSIPIAPIRNEWDDQSPALGMCASDAVGYVRWLNRTVDEKRGYRLPRPSELSVAVVRRLLPVATGNDTIKSCVWAASEQASTPELWVPPGVSHPYAIKRQDLFAYVHGDSDQLGQIIVTLVLLRATVSARLLTRYLERNTASHPSAAQMAAELSRDLISWPSSHLNVSEAYERARVLRQFCEHEAKRPYSAKIMRILDTLRLLPRRRVRDLASQLARNLDFDLALISGSEITSADVAIIEKDGSSNIDNILVLDAFRNLLIGDENEIDSVLGRDRPGVLGNLPDANQVMSKILPVALVHALAIPGISKTWIKDAVGRFADASRMSADTQFGMSESLASDAIPGMPGPESAPDIFIPKEPSTEFLIGTYNPEFPPLGFRPRISLRKILSIRHTADIWSEEIVFPDSLADNLRSAVGDICDLAKSGRSKGIRSHLQGRESWISDMGSRLLEQAIPALETPASVEREVSVGIRLAALCLAAEASALGEAELGVKFEKIAAGITVLERRSSGVVPVVEMIVLVPE
jgi:hypothetical protein